MFPHSAARGKRVDDAPVLFPLKLRLGEAAEPKHDRPASINRRRREVASELLFPPLFQHRQPDVRLAVEASCYSPDFKHLYGPDRSNGPRFDCYGKRGGSFCISEMFEYGQELYVAFRRRKIVESGTDLPLV